MTTIPPVGVGDQLASYRIEALVGRGAMGVVYRATDLRLSRRVALKLLASSLATDPAFRERFLRESRAAASVDHPGVLPVYETGEADGLLFLAMRYVDGEDLSALLRREGPLSLERTLALAEQLADALDVVHARGLVHRDVKPSNVMVSTEGSREHAYLADFGITKLLADRTPLTGTGTVMGTVSYAAPEAIRGNGVDGRADVYSLGCVLVECLTGRVAFPRDSELGAIYAHLEEPPPRVTDRRPELRATLDDIVARALAKDPDDRFPTAGALAAALGDSAPAPARTRRPRPRVLRAGLAAALALTAVAVAGVILLAGAGGGDPAPVQPGTIALLDERTLEPVGAYESGGAPDFVWRASGDEVWTIDLASRVATRIDSRRRVVTGRVPLSEIDPGLPAVAAGSLWVGDASAPAVARYDPTYGTLAKRIDLPTAGVPFPDQTGGLAVGAGSVWVAYGAWPYRVARIDPATNRVVATVKPLPSDGSSPLLVFGDGALWIVVPDTGRIWKVDPASNGIVAGGSLHGPITDAVFVADRLWLATEETGQVWEIGSRAEVQRSLDVGGKPSALGAATGAVLVTDRSSGRVSRIDARTGRVTSRRIGHAPVSAAVTGGRVWVAVSPSAADARRGLDGQRTIRMATQGDPWDTTDPALALTGDRMQLQRAIGGRLLGVPDREQPRQGRLVPELADLPTVSADGRTYRFRMRHGFRFSPPAKAEVTAQTMRRSIERALWPGYRDPFGDPSAWLSDLEGFAAYRSGAAEHVSGIRVRGDTLEFRLRRAAPDFPVRVSLPQFSAVPDGTPVLAHGVPQPIPSAGPYYLASHIAGVQSVLRRNPNYGGNRRSAPDAIVVTNAGDPHQLAHDLLAGRTDVASAPPVTHSLGAVPRDWLAGGALDRRYGARTEGGGRPHLLLAPFAGVRMLVFNTRRGIFSDPRLRRAVSLALDRRALAGVTGELPWTSLVGPAMPGAPDAGTAGPGPDLARAKALARGRGGRALLHVDPPDRCPACAAVGERVRRQLAPLGIDVTVRASAAYASEHPHTRADLDLAHWIYDWADPSNGITQNFDPGHPLGYGYATSDRIYDDAQGQRVVRDAAAVSGVARDGAYRRAVAELGRRSPPAAPISLSVQPTLLGARVGCAVGVPQDLGYLDLAALCLR